MTSLIAIICYALAWVLLARFNTQPDGPDAPKTSNWQRIIPLLLAAVAVVYHLLTLNRQMLLPDSIDVNIINLFALLAVLIVIFNWLISRAREQELLELAVYPLAALSLVLLDLIELQPVMLSNLGPLAATHITSSLLAYALLSICALIAIQIAVQDAMLRRHRAVRLLQKIPLTGLEQLLFQLIFIGVLLLSVSLISGIWFIDDWTDQHLVHKTILSMLSWLVFSILLFGRWRLGWRGVLAVRLTLAGMALLVLAYFGSKWVLEVVLNRSWSA